jgi:hypothetical protein
MLSRKFAEYLFDGFGEGTASQAAEKWRFREGTASQAAEKWRFREGTASAVPPKANKNVGL